MQRRRFKHMLSFPDRLEQEGRSLKHRAHKIRRGKEREMLLRRASQLETAVQINDWLSSQSLQAPK
jgi:hypothetical protein